MSMTQNILSSSPVLIESLSSGVAPVLMWIADHKGLIQFLEGDLPFNIEMAPGKAAGKSTVQDLFRLSRYYRKFSGSAGWNTGQRCDR